MADHLGLSDFRDLTGLLPAAQRLAVAPSAIAYLGNSVTVQRDGYRPYLHTAICRRFGHAHRQINAGFGAVGSLGSVCTMDDLVIRHKPILCFIECMTGDMGVGLHADTGPALEGIVQKLGAINCSECFLNLPRRNTDFSRDNPIVAIYHKVAAHYGIPSIDLGPQLRSESSEYFRDNVHTTATGGRRTAELILSALEPLFLAGERIKPARPIYQRDYSKAGLMIATSQFLRDRQAYCEGVFKLVYPFLEFGPENQLIFQSSDFELLGLLYIIGGHSGATLIDGKIHQLRDHWDHYERLHAHFFEKSFAPNRCVPISPVEESRSPSQPPPKLKIVGFLVKPYDAPQLRQSTLRKTA